MSCDKKALVQIRSVPVADVRSRKARCRVISHTGLEVSATGLMPCAQHEGLKPARRAPVTLQSRNGESTEATCALQRHGRRRRVVPGLPATEGTLLARKTGKARVPHADTSDALKESTNTRSLQQVIRKTGKTRLPSPPPPNLSPQHTLFVARRSQSRSLSQRESHIADKENQPRTLATDAAHIAHDMSKTSLEQAEARLCLLLRQTSPTPRSTAAMEVTGANGALYDAAASLLASAAVQRTNSEVAPKPFVDIVEEEGKLGRRAAVASYAASCARLRAHTESGDRDRRAEAGLGAMSPILAQSMPYATAESLPRADSHSAVTPPTNLRRRDRNRSSSPWQSAGVHTADSPSPEPCTRRVHDRHLHDGPAPYDTATFSGSAYPSTPQVGVRCGVWQRHRLTRAVPAAVHGGAVCMDDLDTLALKRARESAARRSLEQPAFVYGTERSPCEVGARLAKRDKATQGTHFAQHPSVCARKVMRYDMEAQWKRAEKEQQARRTGRARIAQPQRSTSPW